MTVKEWIAKVRPRLDGKGFTFGNKNSSQSIDVKNNTLYYASFDGDGVFIDNFNHKYNAYMTNFVAFNKLPSSFS